ncbi:hypothetical protein BCR33DRAFT_730659, partial [Rhizoclosmatium globosum]
MAAARVEDLLKELDQSMEQFTVSHGPGPRPSPAQYTPVVNGVPPPVQRVPPVVVQQQQRYQEEYAQYQFSAKTKRAKIELERQRSMSASASQYSGGGYSGGTKKTSIHSGDSGSGSTSLSKALKSRAVSTKTAAKSAYGWTGKCSVRQP